MSETPPFRYNAALAQEIESGWQVFWREHKTYEVPNPGELGFDATKPKKYVLDMFPYPSGVGLHVGHPLGYIATDIYARYLRMAGYNVLHTMGFDAFGLPAEQFALQTGTHPRVSTEANIATMRAQLTRLGLGHDPHRSVSTTDPEFYKWTQWIFLQIYQSWYDEQAGGARPISELIARLESGQVKTTSGRAWAALNETERSAELDTRRLAFLAEVPVNWCPMLGTVLANEEVTAEGRSERGNYPVYKRPLRQWMMRITAYAERLLLDLDKVDWPEPIKLMQRNWIGKSEGAVVEFAIANSKHQARVFTTRPDTLFGATYMVLSPEHPLVDEIVTVAWPASTAPAWRGRFPGASAGAAPREAVAAYRAYAKTRTEQQRSDAAEKTGVFTGAFATNPATGQAIPVFIADYVLMGYGTGAIMAVPAHDERDWAFAEVFGLPRPLVVQPEKAVADPGACFSGYGTAINSANADISLDGLPTDQAKKKMIAWLEGKGLGRGTTNYRLRDWLFSRQRYWGEPFPIVFDEQGNAHAVPDSMLPVLLPELTNFQPESSEDPNAPVRTPLSRATEWTTTTLDIGNGPKKYTRETNTMPNWAGSCWYYLRYLDPGDAQSFCAPDVEHYWMAGAGRSGPRADGKPARAGGVDLYVGGVEHAVLHLLYARFWHKVLFDLGHVSTIEPFQKLFNQGYIQAYAFQDSRGVYVDAFKVTTADGLNFMENQDKPGPYFYEGRADQPVTREYGKMGKSLKNAVSPDQIFEQYGCDTLRIYEMSMGPLEASKPWNPRDIVGGYRFLQKLWRNLIDEETGLSRCTSAPADRATLRLLHKTIGGMRRDMESMSFNTAVSKLIELNNHLSGLGGVPLSVAAPLILMVAPLAPHTAEELWHRIMRLPDHPKAARASIVNERFPIADETLAADEEMEIPISVMGKLRHKIMVPAGSDAAAIEAAARADARVQELIEGKPIKKVIVVPGRMVNFVLG